MKSSFVLGLKPSQENEDIFHDDSIEEDLELQLISKKKSAKKGKIDDDVYGIDLVNLLLIFYI